MIGSRYPGRKSLPEAALKNLRLQIPFIGLLWVLVIGMFWLVLPVHNHTTRGLAGAAVLDEPSGIGTGLTRSLVLINGTVLDGAGTDPLANGVVVIEGSRIVAVGPAPAVEIPANAQVVDVAGRTIMLGIINAHVHNTRSANTRQKYLASGVTATCDMAASLASMPQFEHTNDSRGQPAARGFKSGPMITAPQGYPSSFGVGWDYPVTDPAAAQAAVDELATRGADMIKIALEPWLPQEPWPVLGLAEARAVVETAHRHGLPVRAHVQQTRALDIALAAGVDVIEHTPLPFPEELKLDQLQAGERLSLADYPQLEHQLRHMAQQGVVLVPTLSIGSCVTYNIPELETEARRTMCEFQLEIVGHYQHLGGVVAVGNDYGGVGRGMPLREMELLLAAGLTPMTVIEGGTRYAAQVCGYGDELGTLEPGKLADIIVVEGQPWVDIAPLDKVKLVIKDGQTSRIDHW